MQAKLKAWATYIVLGIIALAAALDQVGVEQVRGLIVAFGVPADKAGAILMGLSVLAAWLARSPLAVQPPKAE